MPEVLVAVLAEAGVLSGLFGFFIWNWQRKITRRDDKRDQAEAERAKALEDKEKAREELDVNIMRSLSALFALSEATAKAVQRIPDAHCNGDMTAALETAAKIQKEERQFILDQGIKHVFGD